MHSDGAKALPNTDDAYGGAATQGACCVASAVLLSTSQERQRASTGGGARRTRVGRSVDAWSVAGGGIEGKRRGGLRTEADMRDSDAQRASWLLGRAYARVTESPASLSSARRAPHSASRPPPPAMRVRTWCWEPPGCRPESGSPRPAQHRHGLRPPPRGDARSRHADAVRLLAGVQGVAATQGACCSAGAGRFGCKAAQPW